MNYKIIKKKVNIKKQCDKQRRDSTWIKVHREKKGEREESEERSQLSKV